MEVVLEIANLQKIYKQNTANEVTALQDISFCVKAGEFLSVVGPSGCGKTTLLMCIAGLAHPSAGKIFLRNQEVTKPYEEMVLVFQDYSRSLLPWRTVLKNVLFGLERKKYIPYEKRLEIALRAIKSVGLTGFESHYPWELSGGMQQRVAIARAIAYEPHIMLMDEPFASVDAQTRAELEDMLLKIWEEFTQTILFVTHDIEESIYLSDRILVLSGRPSVVLNNIAIDLPRPRDQLATRESSLFMQYRHTIYDQIKNQTLKQWPQ